jgi:predicted methyltransferase
MLLACASQPAGLSDAAISQLLASPDRSAADRANDERRKPQQMLAFIGVQPGMRVLDLGAGGGYSTELLARAVGPGGRVYAQNAGVTAASRERFEQRLKAASLANTTLHDQPYADPVPREIAPASLDMVTFFFIYHDQGNPAVDRASMNRAVYESLRPGGLYVIADHSGRPGTGFTEWNTLHRVEEAALRREVEAAGFRLVESADFLRNPGDPRDKPVFKPAQPNDEFVLKFVKPR